MVWNGGTDQELTFTLYFEAHPEELPRWEKACKQFIDSHSNVSFWGYDEEESDAPPIGSASPGRINPDGTNYVLFDVSSSRKYRICNSALYRVNDLLGNSTCILPMSIPQSDE